MPASALEGCDGVISSLGTGISPFRPVTLLSAATGALVSAMRSEKVRRLVCITGPGAGDSRGHGGFLFDRLLFPLLLRNVYYQIPGFRVHNQKSITQRTQS